MHDPAWRRSTYSDGAHCVELADLGGGIIGVRDSKLGDASPVLRFTRAAIAAWLSSASAT